MQDSVRNDCHNLQESKKSLEPAIKKTNPQALEARNTFLEANTRKLAGAKDVTRKKYCNHIRNVRTKKSLRYKLSIKIYFKLKEGNGKAAMLNCA